MSQTYGVKSIVENTLALLVLIGILLIIGSVLILVIGTWLNPSWMLTGITMVFPLLVVGIITLGISVKLLEILQ